MKRIILTTALLSLLVACGSDAESREDASSGVPIPEWVSEVEGTPDEAVSGEGTAAAASTATPPGTATPPARANGASSATSGGSPSATAQAGAVVTFEVQGDVSTANTQVSATFNLVLVEAVLGGGDAVLASGSRVGVRLDSDLVF